MRVMAGTHRIPVDGARASHLQQQLILALLLHDLAGKSTLVKQVQADPNNLDTVL